MYESDSKPNLNILHLIKMQFMILKSVEVKCSPTIIDVQKLRGGRVYISDNFHREPWLRDNKQYTHFMPKWLINVHR